MRRLLPLLLAVLMLPETQAQHTRRAGRHRAHGGVAAHAAVAAADTVAGDGTARVSGFDKALSARRESFFVTNDAPDSADIVWMLVTLDYTDEAGRQLHSRRERVRCHIPSGGTRRVDIPAWDTQHVYYYRLTPPRRRVQGSAAPFDVRVRVDSIALLR